MYLNELNIINGSEVIRNINFRNGINLVVDITGVNETGNDVGKTTTLKLVDFCLGAKKNIIYASTENTKDENLVVKNFLTNNEIIIQLSLVDDIDDPTDEILIERNFLLRKKAIRAINGINYSNEEEFEDALAKSIFQNIGLKKPSFRQLISHNIRYEDESLVNTLKTINKYTFDVEYESLHLFMLGCDVENGEKKQELSLQLKQEIAFKKRLEKYQTRNAYEVSLNAINLEIERLNLKKTNLNLNEDLESDIAEINAVKIKTSELSTRISNLEVRRKLIIDARERLEQDVQKIDTDQLFAIYEEASTFLPQLNKTFEDLLNYHNQMIENKLAFISKRLPSLELELSEHYKSIKSLAIKEKEINNKIVSSDSFDQLEFIITELNKQFQKKGEYEKTIEQLKIVEEEIKSLEQQLEGIDNELFSDSFEEIVKQQVNKFNVHFAQVSRAMYDETYGLTYKIETNKRTGKKVYKFSTFDVLNPNLSSGKKQGEISCFEIAYILFARDENIPHLPFVLNDKKELMHGNQLAKIASLVKKENIQFVCSMLEDKLPSELKHESYYILELSQDQKLFKIED
ncbi:MAG: hypothetical protein ACI81T_003023 [Bacteroidia bacterium]|jgi:uncharacterized protein YydD (DUF2326 family)